MTELEVKQDLIKVKYGAPLPSGLGVGILGPGYNTKLKKIVKCKTKEDLAVYLIDNNVNIRIAAKILIEEKVKVK